MSKFIINKELVDLNAYIKALNSHFLSGNKIKQEETEYVAWEIKRQKIKPVEHYPVIVKFTWYSKDQRKDLDNIAFAKKYVLDGMVLAGILENDSRKFVAGFQDSFFIDKENPRVEVELYTYKLD